MKKGAFHFSASPVKINGHELKGFYYSEMSITSEAHDLIIYKKETDDSFRAIARTGPIHKDLFSECDAGHNLIETAINSIFKDIQCPVCLNQFPACTFTNTKIGKICFFCWRKMEPQSNWSYIENLESYIKKESRTP